MSGGVQAPATLLPTACQESARRLRTERALIHRCLGCGELRENRVAGDDNILVLMAIAARPLANPPVPLEYLPAAPPGRG